MAQDVNIRVRETGAANTANSLKKVDNSIQKMASSALKFGAAYFSAQGLIRGLSESIKLAGIQEAAEKKLSTALGRTSTELLNYASALQQQTTYGDEATISAMAQLSAFTKNENEIKMLTAATQDMAAALGMDLNSAAQLLGKSLESPVNALSRYGVQLDTSATKSEKAKQLTEEISRLWGGQAAAAADTMAGSIEQMKNAIGDTQEAIGSLLAPAIISMTNEITDSAVEFSNFLAINRSIVNEVGSGWEELSSKVKVSLIEQKIALLENAKEMTYGGTMYKALEALGHVTGNYTLAIGYAGEKTDEYTQEIEKLRQQADELTQTEEYKNEVISESIRLENERIASIIAEAEVLEYTNELYLDAFTARYEVMQNYSSGYALSVEDQKFMDEELFAFEMELNNQKFDKEMALEGARRLEAKKTTEEQMRLDQMKKASNASVVAGALGALAQLSAGNSSAAKVTAKLMQAQAIVDTYAGANRALATGVPPFSYIAAAATIAAGLANVSRIQAQAFATGGDFVTNGPQLIMVGDNPGGRERVQVTPQSSPNINGPQGGINITIQGDFLGSEQQADKLAEIIAKRSKQGFNRIATA